MNLEKQHWNHYLGYLAEALQCSPERLKPSVDLLHKKVKSGCTKEELKERMLSLFVPISIMQGLEMWQNYMDLFHRTGLRHFDGKTREEMEDKMYTDMVDGVVDDPAPETHLYDLGSTSQFLIYMATKNPMPASPILLEKIRTEAGLEANWELMMLLGDMYSYNNHKDKAREIYNNLWEANGHNDLSIQDAINLMSLY